MIISFKEKAKFLRELRSDEQAEKDFCLLKAKNPNHPLCSLSPSFIRRNAEKILYALLDTATPEEIQKNRNAKDENGDLNEKNDELNEKEDELNDKESDLDDKESELNDKEEELDDREAELNDKEAELEELKKK